MMERTRENVGVGVVVGTANQIAIRAGTIAFLVATNLWAGPAADSNQVSGPIPTDLLLSLIDSESTAADPAVTQVGPIPSESPDSGTCGNDWAEDHFNRFFTVKGTGQAATFRIFERFKDGSFVTNEGPSPGACDETDGTPPGFVNAGLAGKMDGYLITDVTCDPATACPAEGATCGADGELCQTTDEFIQTFFPGATRNDVAFFFHYSGFDGANQALVSDEWKNASTNRGGNHGDIATCFAGQLNCPAPISP
jgi:hypothetical protein